MSGGGEPGGGEPGGWERVIGLEVHCELRTRTKLFCSCRNAFGDDPNTNICAVCLGLPGSLPVLNRKAVELAMTIGKALHCEVQASIFHRKNYFYPDMPKDYQVSQYDLPINRDGWLELPEGQRIGIERAHMEEDTGKTTHVGGSGRIHEADHSLVDYNRAGVPLVEIVSAPDLRSADDARAYVNELRGILVATGASDGKMEEGSLRVDANVSVRAEGSAELGTRCEVKNMNSLRSLGRAIDYEVARQIDILEAGQRVRQETRHWNEADGRTTSLRSKEEAEDYRYFPEPDLVPVAPTPAWVEAVVADLPALPAQRRAKLAGLASPDGSALPPGLASQVVALVELGLDALVAEAVEAGADAKLAINRGANELPARAGEGVRLEGADFGKVLVMEEAGRLSPTQAKVVIAAMLDGGGDPEEIAAAQGFGGLAEDDLDAVVREVIARHPQEWDRLKAGERQVQGFLIGEIMKVTRGRANGKQVAAILARRAG